MAPYTGTERRTYEGSWHLDKKFAVGVIGAILLNCLSGVWYASKIDTTIQQDHAAITDMTVWREKQDDEKGKIDSHLSVIDEKLTEQTKSLDHVIYILEKHPVRK